MVADDHEYQAPGSLLPFARPRHKTGGPDIGADRLDEMADKCTDGNTSTVGNFVKLDRAAVRDILELAL